MAKKKQKKQVDDWSLNIRTLILFKYVKKSKMTATQDEPQAPTVEEEQVMQVDEEDDEAYGPIPIAKLEVCRFFLFAYISRSHLY